MSDPDDAAGVDDTETKRQQINGTVDTLCACGHRDRLHYIPLSEKTESDGPVPPTRDDLRARIIAAIAQADQDWCSDRPLHEDMADAVIRELRLHVVTVGDFKTVIKGSYLKPLEDK